jgi:hypothetical protein
MSRRLDDDRDYRPRRPGPSPVIIIALAVLAGLFVMLILGGVGIYAFMQHQRAVREAEAEQAGELDAQKILGHKWWKQPPTREQLDQIVSMIVATNKGAAIFIDDVCHIGKSTYHDRDFGWMFIQPGDLAERRLRIVCRGIVRPDRGSVLRDLAAELDSCEYRDGAGR